MPAATRFLRITPTTAGYEPGRQSTVFDEELSSTPQESAVYLQWTILSQYSRSLSTGWNFTADVGDKRPYRYERDCVESAVVTAELLPMTSRFGLPLSLDDDVEEPMKVLWFLPLYRPRCDWR